MALPTQQPLTEAGTLASIYMMLAQFSFGGDSTLLREPLNRAGESSWLSQGLGNQKASSGPGETHRLSHPRSPLRLSVSSVYVMFTPAQLVTAGLWEASKSPPRPLRTEGCWS